MLLTKRAHQNIIFRIFECSNKSSHNSSCHFWNYKVRVIQILHHCSVSWKRTPLYFCSSNLVYFGQKEPIEKKFSDFWVVGLKFLRPYLKPQVSFLKKFASLFNVMRGNSSLLFLAETLYGLDKRNPSKCEISDFWLLMWNFTKFVLW